MLPPSRTHSAPVLLALCLALAAAPAGARADGPSGGGRLVWDADRELDLLGDLWIDLPFDVGRRGDRVFAAVEARTAIERATSDFTFLVRDLEYRIDVGWRLPGARRWEVFAGQRGKERVDADGQAWARYLAVGASAEAPRHGWRFAVGPVLDEREVRADWMLRGAAWVHLARPSASTSLRFEVRAEGLHDDSTGYDADVAFGPRLRVALDGGRNADWFLHWQRSRDPLGIGHSALLVGFAYEEGPPAVPRGPGPPDVGAVLAAGAGEGGRYAGLLAVGVSSPPFGRDLRVELAVEGHVLTAEDTGDLYYRYHLGLARPLGTHVAGVYFYHRSNHQLAEPNDSVTSLNVLEVGIETDGWTRTSRASLDRPWGAIEARARVGWLIDSSFGEDRPWHVRGGVRWTPPLGGSRFAPYVGVSAEAGDVDARTWAIGVSDRAGWFAQIEVRRDDQWFSRDSTARVLTLGHGF